MLDERIRTEVVNATVAFQKKGGMGVLVAGNLILTAAHCIEFKCEGGMALGDMSIENIETSHGMRKVTPRAVEPVTDIAVLGAVDSQSLAQDARRFEEFCELTKPVLVCGSDFEPFQPFVVYIYTPKGWVTGTAEVMEAAAPILSVDADEPILGGAAGGPIINEAGELVGITSGFSENALEKKFSGNCARPYLALPVWVCRTVGCARTHSG